jgi:hypothetical protein
MLDRTILFGQGKYPSLEPVFFEASDLIVPTSINSEEITWRLITSKRVAGVEETLWTHSWPVSSHSLYHYVIQSYRGGKIEFKMSSVWVGLLGLALSSTGGSFLGAFLLSAALPTPAFDASVRETSTGLSYLTKDADVCIII